VLGLDGGARHVRSKERPFDALLLSSKAGGTLERRHEPMALHNAATQAAASTLSEPAALLFTVLQAAGARACIAA
jgi:hypothetical protein